MKKYPSIPRLSRPIDVSAYCIYKYDGSNLSYLYNKKKGWHRFSTRNRLFDKSDPIFGSAIALFKESLGESLAKIIVDSYNGVDALAFCEFMGHKSFAGHHVVDDPKKLILIDLNIHKKGFLPPHEFNGVRVADKAYCHSYEVLDEEFIENVKQGVYTQEMAKHMSFTNEVHEGVVCKWMEGKVHCMTKIKTREYLAKLKERFNDEWEKYN